MDMKRIRGLAQVMNDADLTLLEIVEDGCSIKMERQSVAVPSAAAPWPRWQCQWLLPERRKRK